MTVSSDLNKQVYTGNGLTTIFPFSFDLLQATDLHVYITSPLTGADVEITSDFLIQPSGLEYPCASGNVVYPGYETGTEPPIALQPVVLPDGWKITLLRILSALQETSYPNNTALRPKVVEQDLDRLVMILQQFKELTGRAFTAGVSSTTAYTLPEPVSGAGLVWDSGGNLVNGSPVDSVFSTVDVQAAIDFISDAVTVATAGKLLRLDVNAKLPASITGDADGNASTATALETARAINGIDFDGTIPIFLTATEAQAIAGTEDSLLLTPAKLRSGLNASGSAPVYACRAWVTFNGTGTPAVIASGNVSSITDNGTGDYTVNFTTAISDTHYAVICSASNSVNVFVYRPNGVKTVSSAEVRCATVTGSSPVIIDAAEVCVAIFR